MARIDCFIHCEQLTLAGYGEEGAFSELTEEALTAGDSDVIIPKYALHIPYIHDTHYTHCTHYTHHTHDTHYIHYLTYTYTASNVSITTQEMGGLG